MAKQYYGCIRLTKHNPGWSDPVNDIHLLRTHRTFKCVLEEYDLRPIIKGINAGLIEFTRADIEGTADSDDGARLPMYCGNCLCAAHLIKEGVLADYQADVDYQSDLEWQPPQPAEPPAKDPAVKIQGPTQIEGGQEAVFQVSLDSLKPEKVMVDTGEVDENGEAIMEEQEQHRTVTVSVSASAGNVSPATLTFSSDPAADNYYANAQQVTFQAPDESANVSIEFSGDGVKSFSQSVKVKGKEPEAVVQPVVKINGKSDKIVLDSRKSEFEADITVEYGSCSADAMPLDGITFTVANAAGVTGGSTSQQLGAANMTFANLGTVAATEESLLATIQISCSCQDGHEINQEIKVYVPEKPPVSHMMYIGEIAMGPTHGYLNQQGHDATREAISADDFTANITPEPLQVPLERDISKGFAKQRLVAIPVEANCTITIKSSGFDVTTSQWLEKRITIDGIEYRAFANDTIADEAQFTLYLS